MPPQLRLAQEWSLGERIGGGGFGQVYVAKSVDRDAVAKLVPKTPGAERELLFVDLKAVRNVVPIIDSGEIENYWVLIMPRAEKSLRQHLNDADASLSSTEAVRILSDVVMALIDLDGKVVHRDLKPENVLLLDGRWCLADFGISRYVEATTAPNTQKYALSPPYSAPERWRAQRATNATDVYSVGVMAYEMLSGSLPFAGPKFDDFREQHLHEDPGHLDYIPVALAALVEECLYKAPEARPSPSNLLARLMRLAESEPSAGLAKLQEANRAEVVRRGQTARRESQAQSEAERRAQLVAAARSGLARITDALKGAVMEAAPAAIAQVGRGDGWRLRLNQAILWFAAPATTSLAPWGSWSAPVFDVVAHASLGITMPADHRGYEGRSHSLWYSDAQQPGRYQWFETAFMILPILAKESPPQDPFALDPSEKSAKALGAGINEFQVAWPFTAVGIGDLDEFINRWASWFADVAQGQLQRPSTMPERPPNGSWRAN